VPRKIRLFQHPKHSLTYDCWSLELLVLQPFAFQAEDHPRRCRRVFRLVDATDMSMALMMPSPNLSSATSLKTGP
jgi:hypothetical protein